MNMSFQIRSDRLSWKLHDAGPDGALWTAEYGCVAHEVVPKTIRENTIHSANFVVVGHACQTHVKHMSNICRTYVEHMSNSLACTLLLMACMSRSAVFMPLIVGLRAVCPYRPSVETPRGDMRDGRAYVCYTYVKHMSTSCQTCVKHMFDMCTTYVLHEKAPQY